MARLGELVIIRPDTKPFSSDEKLDLINIFMTPSGDGARYAKCFPSGESKGDVFSGLPKRIWRGMSSSDVVRLDVSIESTREER